MKRFKFVAAIGAILIASIGALLPAKTSSAQVPSTGIAITPPLFEVSANPGETIKNSIRVDNLTSQPLPLSTARKDFVALGEEGQAELTEKPTSYSLSTWIQPDTKDFVIPPKGSKVVNFRIVVPAKAEPGGHFGSIVFHTKPQPDKSNYVVTQEIGALVLLKVAGEAREKADILSFAPKKTLWEKGPVEFETRFKNEGNVQVKPTGTITISNIFGKKVSSVNVDTKTVLPESVRKIRTTWKGSGWPGWYTATVSLNYGDKGQILTSSARFIVFPYKVVLPILLALAILGVLVFRARKRLGRSLRILFGKE